MAEPRFTELQIRAQQRRAQREKNKARKAEVVASEKMADVEWQADVANRRGPLGYAMELDPKQMTYYGTQDNIKLGTQGQQWPEANEGNYETRYPYNDKGEQRKATIEPGKIGIYAQGANPWVTGHEYMHKEFDTREYAQRKHDAFSARTKAEWDQSIEAFAGMKGIPVEKAEKMMLQSLQHSQLPKWERERGAQLAPGDTDRRWGGVIAPKYDEKRNQQSFWGRTLRGN
jgi:hypothetical protein